MKIRKFLGLPSSEQVVFLHAWALLCLIRPALKAFPLPRLRNSLKPWALRRKAPVPAPRIAWLVAAAGRNLPGGASCLPLALATQLLLEAHGHPAELRLGVVPDRSSGLRAHAWVTSGGRILIGGPRVEAYVPLTGPASAVQH